jgi:Flp pilus assembly pilin Flp
MTRNFLNAFIEEELGQDLIESLLLASLVGFAAVFGTFAGDINTAFSRLASKYISSLTTNIT